MRTWVFKINGELFQYRDQPGRKPSLGLEILLQTPQIYSWLLAKNLWDVLQEYLRLNPDWKGWRSCRFSE